MKRIVSALFCIALSGCGASGPQFKASPTPDASGNARLYVYRPDTMIGIINWDVPFIHLDDRPLTRIRIGGYLVVPVPAGRHTLKTTESFMGKDTGKVRGQTVFEVEAGSTVFMRYTEKFKTFRPIILPNVTVIDSNGDFRFEPVVEKAALEELKETELLDVEGK